MHRRWLIVPGALVLTSVLCWFFPLFHLRPLGSGASNRTEGAEKPAARKVPRTLDAYDARVKVTELWQALEADAPSAKQRYGQQSGLGGAWYFCASGTGTVESIGTNHAMLAIEGSRKRVRIVLGVVVDNTVREALGIKASQFDNAQEFNELSAALNRQVEEQVIQANREQLVPGKAVDFVGCGKVSGTSDLDPLVLVPIRLKVRGPAPANDDARGSSERGSAP